MNQIIRGITENKEIRFMAVTSRKVVETARKLHSLDPVSTVIFGRMLTGAILMASDLKNDDQLLTLKIDSDGIINSVLVTADRLGNVKGYIRQKNVSELLKSDQVIQMKEALGKGTLTVIKDLGLKKPYVGTVDLKYGTIGRDLTYYFATSEQTPAAVGLGVLLDEKDEVRQAGGFIIQMMPEASETSIKRLETNLQQFPNFTDVLDMGHDVREILDNYLLKGFAPVFFEQKEFNINATVVKRNLPVVWQCFQWKILRI